MKIKIQRAYAHWRRNQEYDIPDGVANELVRRNVAVEVKPQAKQPTPRRTKAGRRGTHGMG